MPATDPYQHQSFELEEWMRQERPTPWRYPVLIALVIALILGVNLYFWVPGLQRRVDHVFLRTQTYLTTLRPYDRYVPTPVLLTPTPSPVTMANVLTATPALTVTPTTSPMPPRRATRTATPTAALTPLPRSVQLTGFRHEPQEWNNCGPDTLSMCLSFHGWTGDQYVVAEATKPDKNDKNVSPSEMVAYVLSLGDMYAVTGYATDIGLLKRLLNSGFPVIVETWFVPEPGDEMGHYRLLTGYDDAAQRFVTHDSYTGPDQAVPYAELESLWKVFNRAYVVVCEAGRERELQAMLGQLWEPEAMYRDALATALAEVTADAEDRYAWFNVGTNYVGLKEYDKAARAYDRARALKLPWRMLWYQFGPFEAYLQVRRYQDVIALANANLAAANNLEESYYYRGLARRALGDEAGALEDLRKALHYNPFFGRAAEALDE